MVEVPYGWKDMTDRRMFHPVLSTFVHALPRTYHSVPAEEGAMIRVTIVGDGGGTWSEVRHRDSWTLHLDEGGTIATSQISIPQVDAWRLFTGSATIEEVQPRVCVEGNHGLGMKALETISMIV